MDIDVRHDSKRRRFVARLNGEDAHLRYSQLDKGTLDFESTFVPDAHRKQGIGERIVMEALDFARESGYHVIPTCPFVKHVLEEHPEYQDLLAGDR